MPTKTAFKKHAEETRKALKNFNAIWILKAPNLINFALNMLVTLTVHLISNSFIINSPHGSIIFIRLHLEPPVPSTYAEAIVLFHSVIPFQSNSI
ncbi:hypothetical protein BYT27DRAFT_7257312 [Phlegmacium glaucopus]|nr:hypothetical protein BYT27DRAFT_7257312 [Phlegmacium glaucopus]